MEGKNDVVDWHTLSPLHLLISGSDLGSAWAPMPVMHLKSICPTPDEIFDCETDI